MPRYLCLQRSFRSPTREPASAATAAQMQEMYEQFEAWRRRYQDQLVDPGGRLGGARLVTKQPVTDGPFAELKDVVGGYMIVEAADLQEAVDVASACPGLVRAGSGVEVFEIRPS
jgi:hypothetical protein